MSLLEGQKAKAWQNRGTEHCGSEKNSYKKRSVLTRGANSTLAKLGLKAVKAVRGEDSKGRGQLEEVAQLKFGRLQKAALP